MSRLFLHDFHLNRRARFTSVAGRQTVDHYGNPAEELAALRQTAAVLDLSARGRLCLVGPDRRRFLHGQVTNQVRDLPEGRGCYACLCNAKGKIQSDLNLYCLTEEILLDFEPGLTTLIAARLEQHLVSDQVEVLDAAPHYGLLGVWGPRAAGVLQDIGSLPPPPAEPWHFLRHSHAHWGEVYCMNQPRGGLPGFYLFVPQTGLEAAASALYDSTIRHGGYPAGWQAWETHRIEAGWPRFGAELDETILPHEAGLESRAVSYHKGCYIGQEVINRIRTRGQVTKSLRGLRLPDLSDPLPQKGDRLRTGNRDVGYLTSAVRSPTLNSVIGLGYVRREYHQPGASLTLCSGTREWPVTVTALPFV